MFEFDEFQVASVADVDETRRAVLPGPSIFDNEWIQSSFQESMEEYFAEGGWSDELWEPDCIS